MATLSELQALIQGVVQDSYYTGPILTPMINDLISRVAAGVRMPDGATSPPLPELLEIGTVSTESTAYLTMPADYQRHLFYVADSVGDRIIPPKGGDYYAFTLFLNQAQQKDLTEAGDVYRVCVRGRRLYYQGIPSAAKDLTIYYYRKPTAMVDSTDEPDGIPDHLATRLIKHGVCMDIFGGQIEDGQDNRGVGATYHTGKFFEAMTELMDYVGIDAEPVYYGAQGGHLDYGACD